VVSTVTTSGNLEPADNLNVNFQSGGILRALYVSAGQHVNSGDALAEVDNRAAAGSLATAKANVNSAAARLAQLQQVLTPSERTQNAAQATQAQVAVDTATTTLGNTQTMNAANAGSYQRIVDQATAQRDRDRQQLSTDQTRLSDDQSQQSSDQLSGASANQLQQDSASVRSDQQAVDSDNAKIAQDESQIAAALDGQTVGLIKDKQSLDSATSQLNSARASQQTTLAGNQVKAQSPKAGDLAAAQASLTSAQAGLDTSQRAMDDTILKAPSSGTVASISGKVGESVSGGAGASSTSSSSAGSTGGSQASSDGSQSSTGSSSGAASSGFIVLTNLDSLQVKAGFSEADAAKIKPGEAATLTFDALPGQSAAAKVSSIDATSTTVSNVVTYYAILTVDNTVEGIKPGMTTSVTVAVATKDNVLRVPTAAVSTQGAGSTVRVVRGGQTSPRPVVVGIKGDDGVEIVSGLTQSDRVATGSSGGGAGPGGPGQPGPQGGGGGAGLRGGGGPGGGGLPRGLG